MKVLSNTLWYTIWEAVIKSEVELLSVIIIYYVHFEDKSSLILCNLYD